MELSLPPNLERALTEAARRQQTTPERLALRKLHDAFAPPGAEDATSPNDNSLADFLGEHIGALRSSERIAGSTDLSERTGEKFAEHLASKRSAKR